MGAATTSADERASSGEIGKGSMSQQSSKEQTPQFAGPDLELARQAASAAVLPQE